MDDAKASLVKRIFEKAQFVRSLGIELIAFGDGWCETRVAVTPTLEQQHGFVHAGVVMTLAALTSRPDKPSADMLLEALSGHVCRCTGYQGIKRAALKLAGEPVVDQA